MKNKQQDFNWPIVGCALGVITVFLIAVFVVLKIFSVIDWSWWLVFCPLFVEIGLCSFLTLVVSLVAIFKTNDENDDDDNNKGT